MKNIRILAAVSALIMACPLVMCGCDSEEKTSSESAKEAPFENYITAFEDCDVDAYMAVHPEEYIKSDIEKFEHENIEELKKSYEESISSFHNDLEDVYGDNINISYEITDEKKLNENELKELIEDYKEIYGISLEIEEAYDMEFNYTISGDDDSISKNSDVIVMKINAEWVSIEMMGALDIISATLQLDLDF